MHFTTDEPSRIEFYYGPNSERVREIVARYDPPPFVRFLQRDELFRSAPE